MLDGERFHSIKDLVFHVASVGDSWVQQAILRVPPVLARIPVLEATSGGPDRGGSRLLDYWRDVEQLRRVVAVHDSQDERYRVDGLLWHVMIHEMRHTAQIAMLLRMQGIAPPSLELCVADGAIIIERCKDH